MTLRVFVQQELCINQDMSTVEDIPAYRLVEIIQLWLWEFEKPENWNNQWPRTAWPPRSYQPRERRTICTTDSITGTSTSTPTTVASAAPD